MSSPIRVAILDDHQSTIDGYLFRLEKSKNINAIVGLGRIYNKLKNEELSVFYFEEALSINRYSYHSNLYLKNIYMYNGFWKNTYECYINIFKKYYENKDLFSKAMYYSIDEEDDLENETENN